MKKKRIRGLAEERIDLGYSRQHIQNELEVIHPEESPERIAKVLRFLAPDATRSYFRSYQQGLLVAVIVLSVLELVRALEEPWAYQLRVWGWFSLIPFATLFLGYSIYRWRGNGLWWLAVINGISALGLVRALQDLAAGDIDPLELSRMLLSLAICILATHLYRNAFPKFNVVKDRVGNGRVRIVFPPEPGMAMM